MAPKSAAPKKRSSSSAGWEGSPGRGHQALQELRDSRQEQEEPEPAHGCSRRKCTAFPSCKAQQFSEQLDACSKFGDAVHPGSRRFGAAVAFLQFLFPATACILSCSNNCCLEVDWKDSTTNAWHCIQKSSFQHAAVLVYAGMTAYRCTHPGVDDAICSTTPVSAFLEGLLGLRQGDAEHLLDVKLSSSPSDSSLMWLLVGFLCGAVQRQASCCPGIAVPNLGVLGNLDLRNFGTDLARKLQSVSCIQSRLLADIAHAVRGEKSTAEAQLVSLEHLTM